MRRSRGGASLAVAAAALLVALGTAALAAPAPSTPPPRPTVPSKVDIYAIIVGHNDGAAVLPNLRYADDDALRFYRLMRHFAPRDQIALFTELDVETWRQIQATGEEAPLALPPQKSRIQAVFSLFKRRMAEQRRRHPERRVHFFFFYSGHGERGYFMLKRTGRRLVDSVFTGVDLRRAFADSPADVNQVFIDACKSQSLFTTKGGGDDELGPDFGRLIDDMERAAAREASLGIITSTQSERPSGEALDLHAGYFSHVLASGLTGAADADGDGIVQFREVAAFVALYTRRLSGQQPWFHAPQGRLDQPLLDLRGRHDLLLLPASLAGHFLVLDGGGQVLLAELHKAAGRPTRLVVPQGRLQVIRVDAPDRGWAADLVMAASPVELQGTSFRREIGLGPAQRQRGAASAPSLPGDAPRSLLAWYNVEQSGFIEPLSLQAVELLEAGFGAGRTPPTAGLHRGRHALFAGYGWTAPPVRDAWLGQEVLAGYRYQLRSYLGLGLRGAFAFSSHVDADGKSFQLSRSLVEAVAHLGWPASRRLDLLGGIALGWQVAFVTREPAERLTTISGDPAGFRASLEAGARVRLVGSTSAVIMGALALDILRQCTSVACDDSTAHLFLAPGVTLLLEHEL